MEEEENGAPTGPLEESGYIVDDPNDPGEILFTAVMGHRDVTGRIVSLMFRKLPRQQEFPAYYEIIDNPIDLCDIAIKIKVRLKIEKSDFMETSIFICHNLICICKMLQHLMNSQWKNESHFTVLINRASMIFILRRQILCLILPLMYM